MAPLHQSSVQLRQAAFAAEHRRVAGDDVGLGMDMDRDGTCVAAGALPSLLGLLTPLWPSDASSRSRYASGAVSKSREFEKEFVLPSWAFGAGGRRRAAGSSKKQHAQVFRAELRAEASCIVSEFCRRPGALRVEPTVTELKAFWRACYVLPAQAVVRALSEQLSWSDGDMAWQPRFRAIAAMAYFVEQDSWGQDVARRAVERGAGALEHLEQHVPQCAAPTRRLLERLERGAASGLAVGEFAEPL